MYQSLSSVNPPTRLTLIWLLFVQFPLSVGAEIPTLTHHQKLSSNEVDDHFGEVAVAWGRRAATSVNLGRRQLFWSDNNRQWTIEAPIVQWGKAISIDQFSLISPQQTGADYILWSDETGGWTFGDSITNTTGNPQSLAKYRTHAALGFPNESVGGVVRVYQQETQGWQYIDVFGGVGAEEFGYSLDIFGETLVIGSPRGGSGVTGEVNIYQYANDQWNYSQTITAPSGDPGNEFGRAVALSQLWLAVGAPAEDTSFPQPQATDVGAVHLYYGGTGQYVYMASFFGQASFDAFGSSVDLQGRVLAVGSPLENVGSQFPVPDVGAAYVYWRIGTSWGTVAHLQAGDWNSLDRLGTSVAISRTGILAGAPYADGSSGENEAGALYYWDYLVPLFVDGFESGDTSAWSEAST